MGITRVQPLGRSRPLATGLRSEQHPTVERHSCVRSKSAIPAQLLPEQIVALQ